MKRADYIELGFPVRGVDRSLPGSKQAPGTTSKAVNVLAIDGGTGELRGSKRPGLRLVGSAPVGPTGHVQHIAQLSYANPALVTYTPAADGGAFLGSEKWQAASGNGTTIMAETFDGEGNRYSIDVTGSLFKVNVDGKTVWLTTIAKKHPSHVFRGIAVGANGDVYVGSSRFNSLQSGAIVAEAEKKGQEKATLYRFRQVDITEGVQVAQLAWEVKVGRYIVDMRTSGGYLVTLEEDIGQGWAYAVAYQSLVAGAPTVRWKTRIPYPCNSLDIGSDGTVYVCCEPDPGAVGASVYSQSRRNAEATASGTVGPINAWTIDELKKHGWRVYADYRADQATDDDAALEDGAEILTLNDVSGNARNLSVPAGQFTFTGAVNIEAQGPRLVKKGPNGLPELRFLGITGTPGTPASQKFCGLVSDPPDSTAEQSEFENRSALPSYDNCAFMVILVLRPEFGTTSRQAVLAQDFAPELVGGSTNNDIPLVIAVNQQVTAGAWNTTPVLGHIEVADEVYTGGGGGNNATSPPNGVSYAANYAVPLSIDATKTENAGLGLPHGYCIVSWICDGKFTGAFKDDTVYLGTMSQVDVNGTVLDRYGGHQHHARLDVFPNTSLGFSHNAMVDINANGESFAPYRGGFLRMLVLNRYDKSPTTGLHTNTDDAATADPIIASHYLLPNDNTLANVPGDADDQVVYSVSDQVAGASTITTDEKSLIVGALSWEWGFECLPRTDDAVGPPFNYKKNPFAKDPCTNRAAAGAPPVTTDIVIGGPRDPNWLNYPHGMVIKLNGDNGSQVWVGADYTAGNNKGLGVGIALVQDYGDDEANPSVRKLVSYGPDSQFKDVYARILTDNGETVTVGAPFQLYTTLLTAVILRDRYPKCGRDRFGNAFIPGNFTYNFGAGTAADSAFSLAVVKKDGTVRLHYDVTGASHQPAFTAFPDPISPTYPESLNKLAHYVILGIDHNAYSAFPPTVLSTTAACLRKIELVSASAPSGVPRVTEYVTVGGGYLKKYTEVGGMLIGPTALVPAGPHLSTTSNYARLVVGLERVIAFDGQTYVYYDPKLVGDTVKTLRAKKGRIPERCLLGTSWLQSFVLGRPADSPTEIFMCRTGDMFDWDFDPSVTSTKQAVRLQLRNGAVADPVTALIPMRDDLLLVGGETSISRLSGHPMQGGRFDNVSTKVGILFDAWTRDTEGNLYFASNSLEIYRLDETGGMQPISGAKIREALQQFDLSLNRIVLAWDPRHDLLVVFQVPWTTFGTARTGWVWQRATQAWFEVDFETADVQPTCAFAALGDTTEVRRVIFGSEDGWLRLFDPARTYDESADGTKRRVWARARLGPVLLDGGTEVSVTRARVILGDTDEPTDLAQGGADLELFVAASPDNIGPAVASATLTSGHNPTIPVRATGCMAWADLSNANVNERMAVERVLLEVEEAGEFTP